MVEQLKTIIWRCSLAHYADLNGQNKNMSINKRQIYWWIILVSVETAPVYVLEMTSNSDQVSANSMVVDCHRPLLGAIACYIYVFATVPPGFDKHTGFVVATGEFKMRSNRDDAAQVTVVNQHQQANIGVMDQEKSQRTLQGKQGMLNKESLWLVFMLTRQKHDHNDRDNNESNNNNNKKHILKLLPFQTCISSTMVPSSSDAR